MNKLASRLASVDLSNVQPDSRNNQDNRDIGINGAVVLGMSDVATEHQSPNVGKQLRNDSQDKDEDDEYIDKLLPQARKIDSTPRSKSDKERLSRKQSHMCESDEEDIVQPKELDAPVSQIENSKPILKIPKKALSTRKLDQIGSNLTINIGKKFKPQSENNLPIASVLSKSNASEGIKPRTLKKMGSAVLNQNNIVKRRSIVIPSKFGSKSTANINHKESFAEEQVPDISQKQSAIEKTKKNHGLGKINLSFESSTSSIYDDVEVLEPSTQFNNLIEGEEGLKSPPAPSNIAWDLKDPKSPLRTAIRRNHKLDFGFGVILEKCHLDPIVEDSKYQESTPNQHTRQVKRDLDSNPSKALMENSWDEQC